MEKKFSDVFPDLQLDQETNGLMAQTEVTRITMTKSRDRMKVHITSDHLIEKNVIFAVDSAIQKQVFQGENVDVKIIERFRLSRQYTAKALMPMYRESILQELKAYNNLLYDLFKAGECEFPDESTLSMTLKDNVVSLRMKDELIRILEKIFTERCGVDLKIQTQIKAEEGKSRNRELAEIRVQQQLDEISRRMGMLKSREEQASEPKAQALPDENKKTKISAAAGGAGASAGGSKSAPSGPEGKSGGNETGKAGAKAGSFKGGRDRGGFGGSMKRSDNPDVILGRDFEDDAITLESIVGEMGQITIRGQIRTLEFKEIRNEKTIIMMDVTDFTDTITVKIFARNDQLDEIKGGLKQGIFVKIKGVTTIDRFDSQLTIGSVFGIKKIADFRSQRMDTAPEKRVELHCHTKMSDMDGVSDVGDIVRQAMKWGMEAIAITDHGVVQAFPDADHMLPPDTDFKPIYGCEGYLVDDTKEVAVHENGQLLSGNFVVFDLETTGFSPVKNRIIEIGAVRYENGKITDRFSTFVNPQEPIPYRIEQLTSINDSMVMDSPAIDVILPQFLEFVGDAVLVAHNAAFDVSFIEENCRRLGMERSFTALDTVALARVLLPALNRFKLDTVAKAVGAPLGHHHRAVDDAECTALIFDKFVKMLEDRDVHDLKGINELGKASDTQILKLPTYHIIILATNDIGRVNLYKLVSMAHLKYFNRRPRIPKSVLQAHREGLILGSACEAGEVFRAITRGATEQELASLVSFYDYLEIQPIGNNMFMTRDDQAEPVTVEDLKNYNREIVALGEQYGKPVCATCDVHFLNPSDSIYREIIMSGKGFKDAADQAPLYLRTTEEMLKEFEYLGVEKAREVVITNTRRIAAMCQKICPTRPDKCPPIIENSDETLTKLCYDKAHEIYGEVLPEIVEARLKRELNSIISNGFAVMYIIAQKLVWKSVADGYLVGSRGSVGSSLVAYLSGITEVNSLSPHYLCPKCRFVDFDSPEVRKFSGMAGCDMPDRVCPECGEPLEKLGFDIPFETFLGFKGNKEPDIDLNFSGEYQSKAHRYTEVIFGAGQTFRAGTIGTLADKTAFGYVKHYFEDHGQHKRTCEINRIVEGCVGVRRATGQHPGGIVVLPYGEEINTFTPVQHPANDMTTDTITTHFDYHKIDHNLLKLDILGHDDPTMIRMLEDLTGLDATKVPLDDKAVMSLFQNTSALGITPEQIGGCQTGSLGIPEFGTEFAIQMLVDTQPQYFSDLVRISGLSHGTDVWLGNAQTLIQEGKATISTAICCRDDIMIYLIDKGLDSEKAFTIMEAVRKGKGLKPDWEEDMKAHDVPDWYIWSCKKIKYMFPKAHAAAYVMMAWRIAWFKINEPLAYYSAYFSIRSPGFDYELMCLGEERLLMHMKDYEKRMDELSNKEQDEYKAMKVVREMYERGYDFAPIDIYKCRASKCSIVDGKVMPCLTSIDGMGANAAAAVVDAVKDGPFLSKQDFRNRTKVPKTTVDLMVDLGILKNLPETNQLSLFDFA